MMNLTPQEEQDMIERAKTGDPEANYRMSLWALEQAALEPTEERWNRLAAKCLVRAADAGHAQAKARMNDLLSRTEKAAAPDGKPQETVPLPSGQTAAAGEKFSLLAPLKALPGMVKSLFAKKTPAPAPKAAGSHVKKQSGSSFFDFSQWDDGKWKKIQVICIVICVILAVLITVMIISGHRSTAEESVLPSPSTVPDTEAIATPEPDLYPEQSVREEIEAANLEIFPSDEDYVDEETFATVSTSGSVLRLRRGPGASYGEITSMENGTSIEVFAYKNNWALVLYNDSLWGWCSEDYLD